MPPSRRFFAVLSWLVVGVIAVPMHAGKRDKTRAYVPPLGYHLTESLDTGEKPQSKLWHHDGSFWCVLRTPDGAQIHELVGHGWTLRQALSGSAADIQGRHDVLWNGSRLIVAVHAETSWLLEFDYDRTAREYVLRPGFPLALGLAPGSETLVIEEDSTGRLWAAYTANGTVYAAHAEDDEHRHWNLPGQVLRDSTSVDDISSVIAFGDHVGVFWSDQNRDEFGFRVRADVADPEEWQDVEVVRPFPGSADDHVNLAADGAGRVYAATKSAGNKLAVHMRSPMGAWTSTCDSLGGDITRPIVMTADDDDLLVVLDTRWHRGLDTIEIRTAPLGRLEFSVPEHFMAVPAVHLGNVTGLKRSLPAGSIVAVADGAGAAWWNRWGTDETTAEGIWPLRAHAVEPVETAELALAFDEGAGSMTADAARGGHGVLGGPWAEDFAEPTWTEGISGQALQFDGEHQFVSVTPGAAFEVTGSMTMECWFRSWPRMRKQVLLSGKNFYLHLQWNDEPKFSWDEVVGDNHTVEIEQAVADTLWHHLAYVYDEARQESRLYLDGRLGGAAPDSQRVIENPTWFFVGMRLQDRVASQHLKGAIDQVRITAEARYHEDFVPERSFDATGPAITFLQWTPRSHRFDETYEVFRQAGTYLERLNPVLLTTPVFFDKSPDEGPMHYEVGVYKLGRPTARAILNWSPPNETAVR